MSGSFVCRHCGRIKEVRFAAEARKRTYCSKKCFYAGKTYVKGLVVRSQNLRGTKRPLEENKKKRQSLKKFWNKTTKERAILAKIHSAYRNVLKRYLHQRGLKKSKRTEELLGYSSLEFRSHLENLLKPGMTWENYGYGSLKWNVDHVRPIASFPIGISIAEVNSLSNLQPMWQVENFKKKARWG